MSWNERRKNWVGRPRQAQSAPSAKEEPIRPTLEKEEALMVPAFPVFSPAAIAELLNMNRGSVHYYLENGKLAYFRDNIGERYILREELVRFVREYLGRAVHG